MYLQELEMGCKFDCSYEVVWTHSVEGKYDLAVHLADLNRFTLPFQYPLQVLVIESVEKFSNYYFVQSYITFCILSIIESKSKFEVDYARCMQSKDTGHEN